jgi:NtrC-family two-component system sensor histidine kinase KinB
MKISIRTKFTLGICFFFLIIVGLLIMSSIQLNTLSKKTGAILKENHVSVVCAREMAEALSDIDREITGCFVTGYNPDSINVAKTFGLFDKSLQLEKNNITEIGEDKIVSDIELGYNLYKKSVFEFKPGSKEQFPHLQRQVTEINQNLMLLSQMNEKAIELKTNNAKASSKKALWQITVFGSFCFLIVLSFTYSFISYFNTRFYQLHNGIKEIVSSNYGQRLHFDGKDEFSEIALAFNQMAEKLNEIKQKMPVVIKMESEKEINMHDIQEFKRLFAQMKVIEEQASELMSRFQTLRD